MNVTGSGFKNRQLGLSAEQREYAEMFDYSKVTEKSGEIFLNKIIARLGYTSMLDYYLVVCEI